MLYLFLDLLFFVLNQIHTRIWLRLNGYCNVNSMDDF